MPNVAFNDEISVLQTVDIVSFANDLAEMAREAIDQRDEDEIFNAALQFAKKRGLSLQKMALALSALVGRRIIGQKVVTTWVRESASYFDSVDPPEATDAVIARQLQTFSSTVDWEFAKIVDELNGWYPILSQEFFGGALPPSVISVDRTRGTCQRG